MNKPVDEDDRYQILATSSLTLSGARVLKQGDTFAVFNRYGDIRPHGVLGAQGLYHEGARHLSALRLRLGGERLLLLSSTVRENNVLLAVDLMNPDIITNDRLGVPHGTLHVLRSKFLWLGTCYEHLEISNYGPVAVDLELEISFAADFADVFEVRGTQRSRAGELHAPECDDASVCLSYTALDGERRTTRLMFAPAPDVRRPDQVAFKIHLESKQTKDIYLTIRCEPLAGQPAAHSPFENALADTSNALKRYDAGGVSILTANEQFNDWLNRSFSDLRMMISETPHGLYPYAGVPWFSTPFGRDGILTALQALWVMPELAQGVLRFLAANQAHTLEPAADAEPGKIVHELRSGEMARLREIPFGRYYGSVDSTPLFVMLAAAYHEHTGDLATIEALWPNIERALIWIDRYGDLDGDGFVEYGRSSRDGLIHQGWKDSHDAVFHSDGTSAEGPIALCEVQGYVYAARVGAARLAARLRLEGVANELSAKAAQLRQHFDNAFWCDELGTYALALDGAKRPCRVRTSNAGQCLFSGIVLPERARVLANRLLSSDMFSGWGVRTLSALERPYNPMSYHNGSIWPHDNALIAWGLSLYGLKEHALRVMAALFDATLFVELHRLPELFCGFPRRPGEGPTLYPVACSPQSWAAATPFLFLKALLGMSVVGGEARVLFERAALPPFLERVDIRNLRVASAAVDIVLHRHPEDVGVNVSGRRGQVEIVTVK